MSKLNNNFLRNSGFGAVSNNNKLYQNPAKAQGIVITPDNLTYLMAKLIQLKSSDTLLDPCAGTGAFLKQGYQLGCKHLYGIERSKHIYHVLSNNLSGTHAKLIHGNCFKSNFNNKHFDKILLNPPYQLPCIEFIQRALKLLKNGGQLAVIVPESVFVSGGRSKKMVMKQCKNYIIHNCYIKAIIVNNPNSFYPVATQTCILVLKKHIGYNNKNYQNARLYNHTKDGFKLINKHGMVASHGTSKNYRNLISNINRNKSTKNNPNALTAKLNANNGWIYNAFWTNPNPPTAKDFKKSVADYLTFKVNMELHGREYLFKEGTKNE